MPAVPPARQDPTPDPSITPPDQKPGSEREPERRPERMRRGTGRGTRTLFPVPREGLEPARNGLRWPYRDYGEYGPAAFSVALELTWGHRVEAGRAVVGARRGGRSRTLT